MKKSIAKVLETIAKKAAKNAYNSASTYYCYQPKEPVDLKKFVEEK